jgi:hypothetical protein
MTSNMPAHFPEMKVLRRLELKRLIQKLKDHADREKVKSISDHLLDLTK